MDFFGLDIGSHSLRVAQIKREGEKGRLIVFGSATAPARGLLSEAESDLIALAEAIKKLCHEVKLGTKNVAVALPEDKVFTKILSFPKLSEKELKSAIKWEAEQHIPVPLAEVTLDYRVVGETGEGSAEKTEIFLIAAPKVLIEKLLKVIKATGLNPVALETEILALARGLIMPGAEAVLLVDLGARATDMAIVDNNQVVLTRSIPTAGEAITRAVASALELEPGQAEEYKKAYGVDPQKLEGKVREAIDPVIEAMAREMGKVVQFYQSSKQKTIKRIILAGGTAGLPEVVGLLAEKLNLEVQVGDPFIRLERENEVLAKIPAGSAHQYATAIGLALKDI